MDTFFKILILFAIVIVAACIIGYCYYTVFVFLFPSKAKDGRNEAAGGDPIFETRNPDSCNRGHLPGILPQQQQTSVTITCSSTDSPPEYCNLPPPYSLQIEEADLGNKHGTSLPSYQQAVTL